MPRRKCWQKVEAGRRNVLGRRDMLGTVPLAMQSPQMGSNYSDGGVARPTCLSHTNVDRHVLCCPPRGMHMPSEPQSPVLLQATNICQNLTNSAHSNLETKESSDLEVRGFVSPAHPSGSGSLKMRGLASPKANGHLTRKNASCHQTQTNISDIQTLHKLMNKLKLSNATQLHFFVMMLLHGRIEVHGIAIQLDLFLEHTTKLTVCLVKSLVAVNVL